MSGKNKLAMLVAELIGTAILALVFIDVRGTIGYPIFVALGGGLAVGVLTLAVGGTSGAQLNPALTLALWTNQRIKTLPAIAYIAMQLLGAGVAYWLYGYLVKSYPQAVAGHFAARIMIAEALGTFVFAFGWAAAAAQRYKGIRLATTVGGAFGLGIIVASFASNGFINPAIALSSHAWNIWGSSGWSTYVLGSAVGAVVGVTLYNGLFPGGSFGIIKKMPVAPAMAVAPASTKSTTSKKPAKKAKK